MINYLIKIIDSHRRFPLFLLFIVPVITQFPVPPPAPPAELHIYPYLRRFYALLFNLQRPTEMWNAVLENILGIR